MTKSIAFCKVLPDMASSSQNSESQRKVKVVTIQFQMIWCSGNELHQFCHFDMLSPIKLSKLPLTRLLNWIGFYFALFLGTKMGIITHSLWHGVLSNRYPNIVSFCLFSEVLSPRTIPIFHDFFQLFLDSSHFTFFFNFFSRFFMSRQHVDTIWVPFTGPTNKLGRTLK